MKPFVIGFLALIALVTFYSIYPHPGNKLDFSGNSLYYTSSVKENDAKRLGNHLLQKYKVFNAAQPINAQIDLDKRRYILRFIAAIGAENTIKEEKIRELAQDISQDVFNGAPVDVELCDGRYSKPIKHYAFNPIKPKLPVEVTFRKSIGGGGLVAQFLNTSSRILKVRITLMNLTSVSLETITLDLAPNSKVEHGWAEGWNFTSGETIRIVNSEYEPAEYKVP